MRPDVRKLVDRMDSATTNEDLLGTFREALQLDASTSLTIDEKTALASATSAAQARVREVKPTPNVEMKVPE